ncbi:MAG: hypothetical protein LC624_04055 [Halobacteriales archaeon]|nr:hypothetical protein [Halobacteriales archaeon]
MEPVRIPLAEPVLLEPTLKGGQAFRWRAAGPGWAGVAEGRVWHVAGHATHLAVTCEPELGPQQARAWATRYFRLGDGYAAMAARLRREAELRDAVERWWGLRLLQTDPWECLLGFITSIHDSVGAIETRIGRLCRHFGEPVRTTMPGARGWAHLTPPPERIAKAHEARLRSAAGMGFRARYLKGAAQVVVRGDLPLGELAAMPYAEAHEVLLQVPGVGDKVADCVQLYALGHLESFPVDRWVLRAMQERVLGPEAKPRDIVAHAQQRWGKDAGYAQQFLFHHYRTQRLARAAPVARRGKA